jgi:hypothetical protein
MDKAETQISPVASDGKFAHIHARAAGSAMQMRFGQVDDSWTIHCQVLSEVGRFILNCLNI